MDRKVSLVITTYNRPKYLREAINSVLIQTYPHWELLVWNDGSIESISVPKDPRIKFVNALHLGRSTALKLAIDQIEGDYLGWVDDDDKLHPETLEHTVTVLNNNSQIGMVYTNHWLINDEDENLGLGSRCRIPYSPNRMLTDFMTHHFRLMRRSIYNEIGGIDPKFIRVEDYDLCLRLSEVTKISHLVEPLYYYRVHPQMQSSQRREEQRYYCCIAINNALKRRGMTDTHYLSHINGRFQIKTIL